jgi:hypothetical protein
VGNVHSAEVGRKSYHNSWHILGAKPTNAVTVAIPTIAVNGNTNVSNPWPVRNNRSGCP